MALKSWSKYALGTISGSVCGGCPLSRGTLSLWQRRTSPHGASVTPAWWLNGTTVDQGLATFLRLNLRYLRNRLRRTDMENESLCYELVNVNPLPIIDVTRSVKSVLLTNPVLLKFNRIIRRLYFAFAVMYMLSFLIATAMILVPAAVGKWLAAIQCCFQLPPLVSSVCGLRVDLLRCMLSTYEFWFFSMVNIANTVGLAVYLGDLRMIAMISYWLGTQMSICVDANLQARQVAGRSFAAILFQLTLLSTVFFQITADTHINTVFTYDTRVMTTTDCIMNSLAIILILFVRTTYRKRKYLKQKTEKSGEVRCVIYRCRVKLQLKGLFERESARYGKSKSVEARIAPITTAKQSLRFARTGVVFHDGDTVCTGISDFFLNAQPETLMQRRLGLHTLGICGILLVAFVFNCRRYSLSVAFIDRALTSVSCIGLACTIGFVGVFASCLNQGILRALLSTFDFGFISIQVSLVHLCACDIFSWDGQCLVICASWLVTHWILTLDALTPNMRQRLGFRVRLFVTPVIVLVVSIIFSISYDLVFYASTIEIQDRVLLSVSISKHKLEFRVVPFFLGRVWTILLWLLRILWRVGTSDENGMLVLHGNVDFIASREALGHLASDVKPAEMIQRIISKARKISSFRVQPRRSAGPTLSQMHRVGSSP